MCFLLFKLFYVASIPFRYAYSKGIVTNRWMSVLSCEVLTVSYGTSNEPSVYFRWLFFKKHGYLTTHYLEPNLNAFHEETLQHEHAEKGNIGFCTLQSNFSFRTGKQ